MKRDCVLDYLQDGTWGTVTGCFTIVRDFGDVCYHSYFSIMDDLRGQGPQQGKYYDIRLFFLNVFSSIISGSIFVNFLYDKILKLCRWSYLQ